MLIGLAEGELQDPEVQKSALNIIINCVCGPVERVGLMQYLLYTYMTLLLLSLLLLLYQSIGEGRQLLACTLQFQSINFHCTCMVWALLRGPAILNFSPQ